MNKFSEQLLEAFEVAMDEKVSKLQYDKTIQATIVKVENVDTGEYKVKYQDGIMSAFATDLKEEFKEKDVVYVTVPQGDFNNKKFISHKLTNKSISTGQYNQLSNVIINISPEFQDLGFIYNDPTATTSEEEEAFGLIVGPPDNELDVLSEETLSEKFQTYADQYEYIEIKADFKTEFIKDPAHSTGDYGLCVIFKSKQGDSIPYFLNVSAFNGDPYHLYTWSPQSIVVKIPKGQIAGIEAIKFYEKDFEVDSNIIVPNLFMKDLSLSFVDLVDMTQVPYYLNILPQEGIAFTEKNSVIHLEGKIFHYAEEILPESCIYKWFKKDLSIVSGSEGYDKRVGPGWKFIDDEEAGAISKILTVKEEEVPWQQKYRLLVIYNSTTLLKKDITLLNLTNNLNITINQITDSEGIKLELSDKENYIGDWYYLAETGGQVLIERNTAGPIDITGYLLYSPMSFYCQVYRNDIYQGELTYIMQSMQSRNDVSVVFTGEDIFTYDANGDINIYDAEIEKSLTAEIVFNKGVISSACTIKWRDFNGNEITTTGLGYDNSKSMISSVRVDDTGKILYFKVKSEFKQVPTKNNSFKIEISTVDGQLYTFDKQIIFTKTGDPGTNGTTYQSLITITSEKKVVVGNQFVQLTCKVFKGQDELQSGITVEWEAHNLQVIATNGQIINVKAQGSNNKRYVRAKVTIVDEGKTTVLYDFFPIDTATSDIVQDLSLLPKYVQYAANGRNPLFLKYSLNEIPGVDKVETGDQSELIVSGNYVQPPAEFNPKNPIGLLKVTCDDNTIIYHPVPMYINTFGNEAIDGWDGVSVDLGDESDNHIFAPQVGAGIKDSTTNKFTGVVMGRDTAQEKIGLYGYQAGESSFGLMEDGTAFFGKSGNGRIDIDGSRGIIEGGGGGSNDNGMTITLAANGSTDDAIRIGNGNFVATYDGKIKATSADIQGTINAAAGYIGRTSRNDSNGWTIESNRIYSGNGTSRVELNSNTSSDGNYTIWAGNNDGSKAPFRVTRKGDITATSATITGTINAKTGYIGWESDSNKGWVITANKISSNAGTGESGNSNAKYIALSSNGTYAIWAGHTTNSLAPFSVTHQGKLKATSAVISGSITATSGTIGNWSINSNGDASLVSSINGANTRIYINGNPTVTTLREGSVYFNQSDGEKTAISDLTITDYKEDNNANGTATFKYNNKTWRSDIGNFDGKIIEIRSTTKPSEDDTGSINGHFYVTKTGRMYASNAEFRGTIKSAAGTIGGWNITRNAINNLTSESTATTSGTTGMARSGFNGYVQIGSKTYDSSDATNKITGIAFWSGMTYVKEGDNYYLQGKESGSFFAVTHGGKLYCRSADIAGTITSNNGTIGGWKITSSGLSNGNVYINNTGSMRVGTFSVSSSGYLSATGARIDGTIITDNITVTGGSITGSTIQGNTIIGGTIKSAKLESNNINGGTITGTKVSGGTIVGTEIYGSKIYAVENNKNNYLTVTSDGIKYYRNGSEDWSLEYFSRSNAVGIKSTIGGFNISVITNISLEAEGYLKLSGAQGLILDQSRGSSAMYGDYPPSGSGQEGQIYFEY